MRSRAERKIRKAVLCSARGCDKVDGHSGQHSAKYYSMRRHPSSGNGLAWW